MIAMVSGSDAGELVKAFKKNGILAGIVGEVTKEKGVRIIKDGKTRKLQHPKVDPYWGLAASLSR